MKFSAAIAAFCIAVSNASAVYVDFTQYDYGPSETLYIEGVTIQTPRAPWENSGVTSLTTCTRNVGLGCAAVGRSGTIDAGLSYTNSGGSAVSSTPSPVGPWENIRLSVHGLINSVTVRPYHWLLGSPEPSDLPFQISIWVPGDTVFPAVAHDIPEELRLPMSSSWVVLGLVQDSWGNLQWYDYASHHPGQADFQFGFSVLGLDYTPVPEPSSLALVSLATLLIVTFRRTYCRRFH